MSKAKFKKCVVPECDKNAHRIEDGKRGWCSAHYQRWRRFGDPSICKKTPSPAMDWLRAHVGYASNECLRWPFHISPKDGYGRAHEPITGKLMTASRLMCIFAHGEPPTEIHECAHSCGNGNHACTNPRHLYWATPTENQNERVIHGTSNRGERQWKAKLTEANVREIKSDLKLGSISNNDLASRFKIDPSVISDIKRGKKWAWVT